MVLLSTRSTSSIQTYGALPGGRVIALTRLSDSESRELLLALAPDRERSDKELEDTLRQAGGNPFYLQAIARHPRWARSGTHVPLDITSLAARSYYALDDITRTVLECVLVLKDLATLSRVRAAAATDDTSFLRALRILEEDGLLHCVGHDVRCSHDLLAEALQPLLPTTVTALLRERVASRLQAECIERGFDAGLAWAAADAWMTIGNSIAASRLLRRCAAHAARVAEHSEAARMLCGLLDVPLPAEEALLLIDELIGYAEVGGERSIRARALRARLRLMDNASTPLTHSRHEELSSIRVAVTEADLNEAADLRALIGESQSVITDETLEPALRVRAGVSLIIAADLGLDSALARSSWQKLSMLSRALDADHIQVLRARLIYHTVFGDRRIAVRTAHRILSCHPLPRIDVGSVIARRNALFALQILGEEVAFRPNASATYELMLERKIYTEAVYVAVTLAEGALALGDYPIALDWLSRASAVVGRVHETAEGVIQGFMSALSSMAVHAGEYSIAAQLLVQVQKRLRLVATPRLRAINAAYLIRLARLQGLPMPVDCNPNQLAKDYEAGCRLGRQDTVVEGLWLAYSDKGAQGGASRLLHEYFTKHRRETGLSDWSLWNSTQSDPFWAANQVLIPHTRHDRGTLARELHAIIARCAVLT
jgi:hypothetical protein